MKRRLQGILASTLILSMAAFGFLAQNQEATEGKEVLSPETSMEKMAYQPEKPLEEIQQATLSTGSCGSHASFAFDAATGTLVISGTGGVDDYDIGRQPWFSFRKNITSIVIESGITSVGYFAFGWCEKVTSLTLPDTLETIGAGAFAHTLGLTEVYLPASVGEIAYGAFGINYVESEFSPMEQLTLLVESGSYGEAFATEAGHTFAVVASEGGEDSQEVPEDSQEVPEDSQTEVPQEEGGEEMLRRLAIPSTAKVMVNGVQVNFGAYEIDGFNYFRLTDVSFALNGTESQFLVLWDAEKSAINMIRGYSHNRLGDELQGNSGKDEEGELLTSPVYCDDQLVTPLVYTVNGFSYFALDSLIAILGLNVGWDGASSTITITT